MSRYPRRPSGPLPPFGALVWDAFDRRAAATGEPFGYTHLAGQHGRRCWHVEVVVSGAVKAARPKGAAPAAPAAAPAPQPAPVPQPVPVTRPDTTRVPWFLPPDDGHSRRRNLELAHALYA